MCHNILICALLICLSTQGIAEEVDAKMLTVDTCLNRWSTLSKDEKVFCIEERWQKVTSSGVLAEQFPKIVTTEFAKEDALARKALSRDKTYAKQFSKAFREQHTIASSFRECLISGCNFLSSDKKVALMAQSPILGEEEFGFLKDGCAAAIAPMIARVQGTDKDNGSLALIAALLGHVAAKCVVTAQQRESIRAFCHAQLKHPELSTRLSSAECLGVLPNLTPENIATLKAVAQQDRALDHMKQPLARNAAIAALKKHGLTP